MGNWDVETDDTRNRIYLTLEGHLDVTETAAAADAVTGAAERLDPGFDIINDMSTFVPTSEEAMDHIERGKRALAENGQAAAVRVVSESTTGQMQFDRVGDGAESYQVAKAESMEDAETLLDKRRQEA
jgi:hypothetical protein